MESKTRLMAKYAGRIRGLGEQQVYYHLVLAFGLFFVLPSLGFVLFIYKYKLFHDQSIAFFFLAVLVFSYLGFYILRNIAEQIHSISESMLAAVSRDRQPAPSMPHSELNRIVGSFQQLLERLEETSHRLEERSNQIRLLSEFADMVSSPSMERLLEFALEKACSGTGARVASILLLDESRRNHFFVACMVGTPGSLPWKRGTQIPFNETRAAEAIVERRALFVNLPEGLEGGPQETRNSGNSLVAPLLTRRDVLGVLWLQEKRDHGLFNSTDLAFVTPASCCLAHFCENLHLQKLISTKDYQFNCLAKVIKTCNLGLQRGKVFQRVALELRRLMPLKVLFIALFDTTQEFLEVLEVDSEQPLSLRRGTRLSLRQSLFRLVFQENQPVHREDLPGQLHPMDARWFRELGIHTCYLTPFRMEGVTAGILFAGNEKATFTGPQQNVLQQVGEYLGLVIHNSILKERLDGQGRKLEMLELLRGVLVSSVFDLEQLLDRVGTLMDQFMPVEAGAVYLCEQNMLVVRRTFGTQRQQVEALKLPLAEGICGYVVSRRESVLIRDVSQNPHMASLITGFKGAAARSVLCVPMLAGEEVVGVVHLWNKEYDTFTAQDEKVMRSMAATLSIAVAVENFRRRQLRQGA